jgi:hypothetical protein
MICRSRNRTSYVSCPDDCPMAPPLQRHRRLVRATLRGTVLIQVARTSRDMKFRATAPGVIREMPGGIVPHPVTVSVTYLFRQPR